MVVYLSASDYVKSCVGLKAKIAAIDQLIEALLVVAVKAAETENISEYWLNDGQTQIKTIYRSSDQVTRSIRGLETLKNLYVNQLTGRRVKLVDGKNFTGNGW